jgi:hypothetical protein
VAKTAQGLKGRVLKKKFVLPTKSWIFTFFQFIYFLLMVPHDVTLNVIALMNVKFLIFVKKFYKFHSVGVLKQDPPQQKEF